jgi:hypothetical protein
VGDESKADSVNELLNKLSSYNLFNNLLPGALFVFLAGKITHHDYTQTNIAMALAVYYLVGLVGRPFRIFDHRASPQEGLVSSFLRL